jgi:hypothetical protein
MWVEEENVLRHLEISFGQHTEICITVYTVTAGQQSWAKNEQVIEAKVADHWKNRLLGS